MSFKIVEFANHIEVWGLEGSSISHSHPLDYSDAHKKNSFIRELVQNEVAKGGDNTPAAVIKTLRPRKEIEALGGRYLTSKDAANWAAAKRKEEANSNNDEDSKLLEVEEDEARHIEMALKTHEALDKIRARFDEVFKYANTLDKHARAQVLAKWNTQLQNLTRALLEHMQN